VIGNIKCKIKTYAQLIDANKHGFDECGLFFFCGAFICQNGTCECWLLGFGVVALVIDLKIAIIVQRSGLR
jgi:hypothetical protein